MKEYLKEKYKCYVLLDYDVIEQKYLLEIYDFRDDYFNIEEFENISDLVNYYHDELCKTLQVEEQDILQITTNAYKRNIG